MIRPRRLFLAVAGLLAFTLHGACSSSDTAQTASTTASSTGGATGGGGAGGASGSAGGAGGTMKPDGGDEADAPADAPTTPTVCEVLGRPALPFSAGPYGKHRGELADDFTLDLTDGSAWRFKDAWSGCEQYVFVPDTLPVSDLDPTSIWEKDLSALIKASPDNVHYFFVSRQKTDDAAKASTDAMAARVDAAVAKLGADDAAHWKARLHVVSKRSGALGNWIGTLLSNLGRIGFAIDRTQRVRGMGMLADVHRFDQALSDAMKWPWKANLALAANEAVYLNAQVDQREALDADGAKVIPFWDGEVLQEFAEIDVDLPSAAEMAQYDTLEVEVTSACPNPDEIEFGNCGAWDYIASLGVQDDAMNNVEIARFITSYHRETHWLVDASAMLVKLADGGKKHFRWDFAPSWNTQPTATKLSLRLSNRKKGYHPTAATFLWSGGGFGAGYDPAHLPQQVDIPKTAKRVELWAIITGHGAGTNQCSEFCNHQHEFKVNGKAYLKEHTEAGTSDKCVPHMKSGMVPNQGGTWWFGRGGWCPGQQVDPWVVDVTADVTPGETATVEYQGLFKKAPPADGSGDIDMTSYLVVYE